MNYIYRSNTFLKIKKLLLVFGAIGCESVPESKKRINYYPFGMPMPNRNVEGNYRYKYQGQEKDIETGKEAFELRLWDSRIGRWLTTDPYGQHFSPYLGMGNNPISRVDPDGGMDICKDAEGNTIPCDSSSQTYTNAANELDEVFISNLKKSDMHRDFNWTGDARTDWLNAQAYKSFLEQSF